MHAPTRELKGIWRDGDDAAVPVGRHRVWQQALSRRQMLSGTAGLAGVVATSRLGLPGSASASPGRVAAPATITGGFSAKIRSVGSGKVMDVPGSPPSSAPGVQIQQHDDHNAFVKQSWNLYQTSVGWRIQTGTNSNLYLDAYGSGTADHTRVVQYTDTGGRANQLWAFTPVNLGSGIFVIWPLYTHKQLVLDVTGGSDENGARIQLFHPTGRRNQQWRVEATLLPVHQNISG
jgi:Ricin-type beta-trefoil lectin domain-like